MFEQGALHAHIDRTYTLEEIVEAHRYADLGRKKANIAVRVG
jgi:NADPH:quinone reductase-like Zn-dependent oxidoreductase